MSKSKSNDLRWSADAEKAPATGGRWQWAAAASVLILAGSVGLHIQQQARLRQATQRFTDLLTLQAALAGVAAELSAAATAPAPARSAELLSAAGPAYQRLSEGGTDAPGTDRVDVFLREVDAARASLSRPSTQAIEQPAAFHGLAARGSSIAEALHASVVQATRRLEASFVFAYGLSVALLGAVFVRAFRVERRHARTAHRLAASEAIHRSMVTALDQGLMIFDPDGHVRGCNPAAERLVGRTLAEMQSNDLSDWQVVDGESRPLPPAELPIAIALTQGTAFRDVTVGRLHPRGGMVWFKLSVEPLRNAAERSRVDGVVVSLTDITQRRRAEAALHASEATNRALMNSLADGVFVAQGDRIVYANAVLPAMLGYGPEDLEGVLFERVVAPEALPVWNEQFAQHLQSGNGPVRSHEIRFLTRDGRAKIELEMVATRAFYLGKPAMIGVVRDITERQKAAAELAQYRSRLEELVEARTRDLSAALAARAESESFAQTITDSQPTLLAYIDLELRLRFANRAYLAWFGQTREAMIGQRIPDVIGSEAVRGRDDAVERVMLGEAREMSNDMVGINGEVGHFWTHRVPDRRDGKVRGYFFIATNVTELRRAQRNLQQLNAALKLADEFSRLIADNIPGRVAYWDRDLRCRFVNRVYCDWFGIPRDALIGRSVAEVFGEERFKTLEPRLRAALDGHAQEFERDEISADGRAATTQMHYAPDVHDGAVRGVFVLALDVTQSRQATSQLERLNGELVLARDRAEAAARAKSAFLANMSHEIRTPMNAIIGLTHLLRRDPLPPQSHERLARVADAAQHLLAIINNVLDLSKIESGKLALNVVEFELDDLLARTLDLVAESARAKGLTLVIDAPELPARVRGDPVRLSQALANLLSNAVKFTERGSVTLAGRTLRGDGTAVLLRFDVRDTGIGLAPDATDRVFDAFEQADGSITRRFGGTGLGLGITRHLARLMGGDAGAESRLGHGSTFWITVRAETAPVPARAPGDTVRDLPVDAAVERAPGAAALAPSNPPASRRWAEGQRILLVEDHPVNQEVALALLRLAGFQVDLAQDGREAVAMAGAGIHDLILMDMQMPRLDGLQATRLLRAQAATAVTPIIAMTANAYAHDRAACLAAGMNDFLTKPVDPPLLYDMLARWLPASAPADTNAAPLHIPGLDVARGLAFFAGDRAAYLQALQQFTGRYGAGWAQPASNDAAPLDTLRRELHALGGASAAIGAAPLCEQIALLDQRLREPADREPAAPAVEALRRQLQQVVSAIQAALPEHAAPQRSA